MTTQEKYALESMTNNLDLLLDQLLIHAYIKGLRPLNFRVDYRESSVVVEMDAEDMSLGDSELKERRSRISQLVESERKLTWEGAF